MKKLIIITALTTALFADCISSSELAQKEVKKTIEYINNGLIYEACFSSKMAVIFSIDTKVECDDKELNKEIDKVINNLKIYQGRNCK